MAYRFLNDQVSSTTDKISLLSPTKTDSLLFGRDAVYFAGGAGSHVVDVRFGGAIGVDGALYSGDGAAIFARATARATDIRVGSTGLVSSGGTAIDVAGFELTLVNRGEIAGSAYGIDSSAETSSIVNAGTITGGVGIHTDGAQATVANSGTIAATRYGVYLFGGLEGYDPLEITNTGTISGRNAAGVTIQSQFAANITNAGAIDARIGVQFTVFGTDETGSPTFSNTGVVAGRFASFYGSEVSDTIDNHGALIGAVFLNGGDDTFDSRDGTTSGPVDGGSGDDTLIGSRSSASILGGGAGDDIVQGGDGDDILLASAGLDILDGGAGRDLYSFRDLVAGVGARFSLGNLYANVDGDVLTSIEGVEGSQYGDQLAGDAATNWIYGRGGIDILNGGGGEDFLFGGRDNDFYTVDSAGDRVIEHLGQGVDTIQLNLTGATYLLPANVENIRNLTGTAAVTITGNALDNAIIGNSGVDILDGGLGNDLLTGSAGADGFVLSTTASAGNADTIGDFASGSDQLRLDKFVFGLVYQTSGSTLNPNNFYAGTAAQDSSDYVIYDAATQNVYFDADGVGGVAQVLIVHFNNAATLLASDILPI